VVQVTHEQTMANYSQRIIRFEDGIIARSETVENRS
jgi:ABC-type lipoprotein export system ATPase subunit